MAEVLERNRSLYLFDVPAMLTDHTPPEVISCIVTWQLAAERQIDRWLSSRSNKRRCLPLCVTAC